MLTHSGRQLSLWLWSKCWFSEQEMGQTRWATLKTAEEAELWQISKVAESGWVGPSPNSRCFMPSRSKNRGGDRSGARTDAEIGRVPSRFFFFFFLFGRGLESERGTGRYSSPSSGIKTSPGTQRQLRVQTPGTQHYLQARKKYLQARKKDKTKQKNRQTHKQRMHRKHAGCNLRRPVQYIEKAGLFV